MTRIISALLAGALLNLGCARLATAQTPNRQRFQLVQELRIDGERARLSPVTFLLPLRTGGVVVGQRQDAAVRIFDASGSVSGSFGVRGEGPGEFRQLMTGGVKGDTVWLYDASLYRLTLFVPSTSKLLRTVRIPPGTGFPPTVRGVFGPDSLILWGNGAPSNGRRERAWLRGQAEGSGLLGTVPTARAAQVVADFPPYGCFAKTETAGIGIPYCHRPTEAASGNASRVAVLTKRDDGASPGYHAAVIGVSGDTIFSRNYTPLQFPMSPQVFRVAVDDLLAKVPANAREAAKLKGQMAAPKNYPPASFAFFDDRNRLWIGQRFEKGQFWELLDPVGRVVGEFRTREGVSIEAAYGDWVWGTEASSEGVESVVRFRLKPVPD